MILFPCSSHTQEFKSKEDLVQDDFHRFNWYASRVKKIKHTDTIPLPTYLHPFIKLPNLTKVHFFRAGCNTPQCWSISKALRVVSIDTGFAATDGVGFADTTSVLGRCSAITAFLDTLHAMNIEPQELNIRGKVTESLAQRVTTFTTLRVLTLRIGGDLSLDKFVTIATEFPFLRQLDVDAGNIDAKAFLRTSRPSTPSPFPALQTLTIRAGDALLIALTSLLPCNGLQSLHMDFSPVDNPRHLIPAFDNLVTKAPTSLRELTIEYFPEFDEIYSRDWFPIDVLRPLAPLTNLRRFRVTTCTVPKLVDKDIEEMGTWWRHLEHLDLGTVNDCVGSTSTLTPASYMTLAKSCPALISLTLPAEEPPVTNDDGQTLPLFSYRIEDQRVSS